MITLNCLLPKVIRRIETAAELMLVIALNSYTKKYLNERVSCESVRVNKELMSRDIYAYAWDQTMQPDGVIFHSDDKAPNKVASGVRFIPYMANAVDDMSIQFSDTEWVFGLMNDVVANRIIRTGDAPYNYIYVVAKWLVYRYMNPDKKPKLVFDQQNYTLRPDEYSALIILKKWGNQMFPDSLMELRYTDAPGVDSEWVAFCEEKRTRGLMPKNTDIKYSAKDKMNYLMKNLKLNVGDVVLLYRRKASKNSGDITQNVIAAYPAVITKIENAFLTLSYCTQIDTKLTRKHYIDMLRRNGANNVYSKKDYIRFDVVRKSFDWFGIGIEGYSTSESWFIIPPVPDDSTRQWLFDGEKEVEVELNTLETIYAVFEDRGVKYDRQRFVDKYFPNSTPIYEQYRKRSEEKEQ